MFDSKEDLTNNKLIILCFVNKLQIPLSNTQITQFILEKEYTNYFSVQEYLSQLVHSKLLEKTDDTNTTRYIITEYGIKTLDFFQNRIKDNIIKEIEEYININKKKIKNEIQIIADYIKKSDKEYIVNCRVIENDITLIDINLNVVNKEQANIICSNWRKNAHNSYNDIISTLIKKA